MKERNSGTWTEARFNSFIKGALRAASNRWGPKNSVKKKARVSRGIYMCAGFKRRAHKVTASLPPKPGNKRRINNAVVDHIHPVVDPAKGFETWDIMIDRMFCEETGLQILCHTCHSDKTQEEREIRNAAKQIRSERDG